MVKVKGTVYFSSWLRSVLPGYETATKNNALTEVFTSLQQMLSRCVVKIYAK